MIGEKGVVHLEKAFNCALKAVDCSEKSYDYPSVTKLVTEILTKIMTKMTKGNQLVKQVFRHKTHWLLHKISCLIGKNRSLSIQNRLSSIQNRSSKLKTGLGILPVTQR